MGTLENEEIEQKLQELDGWKRADAKTIERRFTFREFLTGIAFVEKIASQAEKMNHHPHITIDHRTVTIRLSTLDEGGITQLDIDSAVAYSKIYNEYFG
ncbi:4a-hydroxytetrahydrobiopterin dehydratase [Alteribacillus iranensis]|uniref:4a-hydroxytetrahydrobiopterin dehydratase n=1 Tax=Alteribacillus iranensis TaxID=930128 RepID=A0A1I2CUG8_9BACI|nr:4a-hydroxytetrahydrobiopterin dehydratase [Alteribacillus iranensis]SFE71961.1 pterin-4-alpha-carbinolamine dehydratase [Alteribacillus iranensis]